MMGCGATTQAVYIHDGAPHSRWHMYDTSVCVCGDGGHDALYITLY